MKLEEALRLIMFKGNLFQEHSTAVNIDNISEMTTISCDDFLVCVFDHRKCSQTSGFMSWLDGTAETTPRSISFLKWAQKLKALIEICLKSISNN